MECHSRKDKKSALIGLGLHLHDIEIRLIFSFKIFHITSDYTLLFIM